MLWLCACPAYGQGRGVVLSYDAGDAADRCPSQSAVENAVSARLGFSPFRPDGAWIVHARIESEDGELRGKLELRDSEGDSLGRRTIESAGDCDALIEAMAVGISVALEPLVPPPEPLEPPKPKPESADPEPPPEPEAAGPPPAMTPPPAVSLATQWEGSVGILGTHGGAPSSTVGFSLLVSVRRPAWSVGLEGQVELPSEDEFEGGSATTQRTSAWLVPCGHADPWFGCVIAGIGSFRSEGHDLDLPRSGQALFAAVGGRVGWEANLSDVVFVRLRGDLAASLTRTTLVLDGQEPWSSPPVLFGVGASIGGRL